MFCTFSLFLILLIVLSQCIQLNAIFSRNNVSNISNGPFQFFPFYLSDLSKSDCLDFNDPIA